MAHFSEGALRDLEVLDNSGNLNEAGKELLARLLKNLPVFHKGQWGEAFVPLMSRCVPACVELVIVRDRKVLLCHRKDEFFEGWHTPGTYIGPGENFQEAAQRCADREIKASVRVIKCIATFLNNDNPWFFDLSNLLFCRIEDEPHAGEWFRDCPPNIIPVHKKFWPAIEPYLS